MLNDWSIRKTAIVESDDFYDRYDRNGLNFLFYWKSKYPKFKITLFTVPEITSQNLLKQLFCHRDWIEIAVHGWNHESNFECYGWDYDKATTLMNRLNGTSYRNIFKAPGWSITPGNNGYPAAPEDLITKDPQAIYRALKDTNYIILDRHYNKAVRPEGCKIVCVDCQTDLVHTHTWNMMGVKEEDRNGFEQVETRGVPWNQNTEFYFVSEAWNKGLFKECV